MIPSNLFTKRFSQTSVFVPVIVLLCLFIVPFIFVGCKKEKTAISNLGIKIDSSYMMATHDVKVYISDSGLLQYKMITKDWYIYDNGTNPRWYFPNKFYIEKFDTLRKTLAYVKADTAYYYTNDDRWELIGHVAVKNIKGEQFYSPHLFWDKRQESVYSNDTVLIIRPEGVLRGNRFWAAQDMSRYEIYNDSGTFEINEDKSTDDAQNAGEGQPPSSDDSTAGRLPRSSASIIPSSKLIKP